MTAATRDTAVAAAADRLAAAAQTRQPCEPVRDLIGRDDAALAYRVQQRLQADRLSRGGRVVGRKIGLTSPAVQAQLGVDRPDFGTLFADMAAPETEPIDIGRLLQPKIEAEVAFVLDRDVDDPDAVRDCIAYAVAALEIVDSRIRDWDISFADTVADNASSGLFVLGARRLTLAEFEPIAVEMSMNVDGVEKSSGRGDACLGDPLNALAWLAATAAEFGDPLRAGEVVLSGALGPMTIVPPGAFVHADIGPLGDVTARFTP